MNAYWLIFPSQETISPRPRQKWQEIWTMFTLYLFLWCMAEPVWVSLAAPGLRLIHRMLPCVVLFILWIMRNVCNSIHGPNSWKLSAASLQGLREDPHLPYPHGRTRLGGKCTLGAASVHIGWKFWHGTLAVGTRHLNTLFCFIQRFHRDCLTFRQSLSK